MRKSPLHLYAPFLVLALVQALLIAVAPSRGGNGQQVDAGYAGTGEVPGATQNPDGTYTDENGNVVGSSGSDDLASVGGGGGGGGAGGAGGAVPGAIGGGGGNGGPDMSHCTPDHKQFAILVSGGPPCVAKWPGGANNGGSTYNGVTKDKIKIVVFSAKPNEQVDAILATQNLSVSKEDLDAWYKAEFSFIAKHYEFYGREIEWKRIEGDCPTTPPDYPKCIAAAQQVVKEHPFMVVWGTSLYADVYDVWAKAGIISVGGNHFDSRYFTGRRPYRYDIFMDGTQSADHIAEYYCKKLAGKPADHAGKTIHPTIGGRSTKRKLGIIVPEIEANVLNAKRVASQVSACRGGNPLVITYKSDIQTATQQTEAVVQKLIQSKTTTVVCMCDPIAPVFLTNGLTHNSYFPELVLPGMGLIDYDLLGRLYDKQQMNHMFGPSHLGVFTPLDDRDAARVWRAEGHPGHPCAKAGCDIPWAYGNFVATALQMAGPNLNPINLERAVLSLPPVGGWAATGHNPTITLANFGRGDYTALGDAKEAYWSATAPSKVDGKQGAYIPVNGGRRYKLGEWPTGFTGIPVYPR